MARDALQDLRKNPRKHIIAYEKVLREDPKNTSASHWMKEAIAYFKLGMLEKAGTSLKKDVLEDGVDLSITEVLDKFEAKPEYYDYYANLLDNAFDKLKKDLGISTVKRTDKPQRVVTSQGIKEFPSLR